MARTHHGTRHANDFKIIYQRNALGFKAILRCLIQTTCSCSATYFLLYRRKCLYFWLSWHWSMWFFDNILFLVVFVHNYVTVSLHCTQITVIMWENMSLMKAVFASKICLHVKNNGIVFSVLKNDFLNKSFVSHGLIMTFPDVLGSNPGMKLW